MNKNVTAQDIITIRSPYVIEGYLNEKCNLSYNSKMAYWQVLTRFSNFLNTLYMRANKGMKKQGFTVGDIYEFLYDNAYASKTATRYCYLLKSYLKYLYESDLIDTTIYEDLDPKIFSDDDFDEDFDGHLAFEDENEMSDYTFEDMIEIYSIIKDYDIEEVIELLRECFEEDI